MKKLLQVLAEIILKITGQYVIFAKRDFVSDNLISCSSGLSVGTVGIVMQGPVMYKNNFTLTALKGLRNKYPTVQIVLSTWRLNVTPVFIKKVEAIGVDILLNDHVPEGLGNVNLQIQTTSAGIKFLEHKCEYILKIRTDQYLFGDTDFLRYFLCLQKTFPTRDVGVCERLIVSSLGFFEDRLYGVPDFLMFGTYEDMYLFWCIPHDKKEITDLSVEKKNEFFIRQGTAEGYLILTFMKNIDYPVVWDKSASDAMISRVFCVVDKEVIGHFWCKYNWSQKYTGRILKNGSVQKELSSADWLVKYCNES